MAHGEILFRRFRLQLSNAYNLVFMRDLVSKVIKRSLPKSVKVWIPGAPRADIETSVTSLLENLITSVIDRNRVFFEERRCFSKYGVE